jgi:hypothetical protein
VFRAIFDLAAGDLASAKSSITQIIGSIAEPRV